MKVRIRSQLSSIPWEIECDLVMFKPKTITKAIKQVEATIDKICKELRKEEVE